jgi:hypothetical protein
MIHMNRFFKPCTWLMLVGSALLSAEVLVRATGIVDFPLYDANAQIGYIPAASQQAASSTKPIGNSMRCIWGHRVQGGAGPKRAVV